MATIHHSIVGRAALSQWVCLMSLSACTLDVTPDVRPSGAEAPVVSTGAKPDDSTAIKTMVVEPAQENAGTQAEPSGGEPAAGGGSAAEPPPAPDMSQPAGPEVKMPAETAGNAANNSSSQAGMEMNKPAGAAGTEANKPSGAAGMEANKPPGAAGMEAHKPSGAAGMEMNKPSGAAGMEASKPSGAAGMEMNKPAGAGGTSSSKPSTAAGSGGAGKPAAGAGGSANKPAGAGGASGGGASSKPAAGSGGAASTSKPADAGAPEAQPGADQCSFALEQLTALRRVGAPIAPSVWITFFELAAQCQGCEPEDCQSLCDLAGPDCSVCDGDRDCRRSIARTCGDSSCTQGRRR